MSGAVDVLAVMDTVARGCALHADKCVGEVGERWAKVATVDYDEARAAVAELIEAATPFAKLECLGASIESSPDDAVAIITIGTIKRVRAALARVQGGAA